MNILGLSCFYHDAAACLLRDGTLVAAVAEERFTRRKHDARFPVCAIRSVLEAAGIGPGDLDAVAFYDKPLLKFDRILRSLVQQAPGSLGSFVESMPRWIGHRLRLPRLLAREVGFDGPVLYAEHHLSHAASSYFTSGWDEAALLTVDGVGEWATASWGRARGREIRIEGEIHFPHSLGLLYSAFTFYCGFRVNSAEYKLMGLAPYGEPRFVDRIRHLVDIRPDGSFALDLRYFDYLSGRRMFNERFEELLGRPARPLDHPEIDQHYKDVARSIQAVTEEIMVRLATSTVERTGIRRLCLAGGVALNCVANGEILRRAPVEDLFVHPAAGDAGGAVGAALWVWHTLLGHDPGPRLPTPYLGPGYDEAAIQDALDRHGAVYERLDRHELLDAVAELIDTAHVVGWFQGRMEWGPRALGHRSILADPRHPEMQRILNLKIKFREGFRPFAPAVLEASCADWFELDRPSPYMLLTAPVRRDAPPLPAVTHVDGSARVQTVRRDQDPLFHDLLATWERRTGCPVLINTSMNVRGEPIVNTPDEAYRCFMRTHMDALAIGPFLLLKDRQPALDLAPPAEAFGLD